MKAWILYLVSRPYFSSISEVWNILLPIPYALTMYIKFLVKAVYVIETNKPNITTLSEKE
jgi:hypothetical protein